MEAGRVMARSVTATGDVSGEESRPGRPGGNGSAGPGSIPAARRSAGRTIVDRTAGGTAGRPTGAIITVRNCKMAQGDPLNGWYGSAAR